MGGDSDRHVNYAAVRQYWSKHFLVYTGTGDTIGEARNSAALRAIQNGHKYLFFVDADIIFDFENVILATKMAHFSKSGVYPYGLLTRLYKWEGTEFLRNYWVQPHPGSAEAGALVLSAEAFIEVCGYPRISWGEDAMLHNALIGLRGKISRIWDDAFHLYHESTPVTWDHRLQQVIRASEQAISCPDKMLTLIERCKYYDLDTFRTLGFKG